MVRPLRVLVENGIFHVTSRGIERRPIFVDDDDRRLFLSLVERVVGRFGWRCLTYCLMDNHFHLLVRTPDANLSRGLQQLKSCHAQAFNRRHGRANALFDGRFYAGLVQQDSHLLELFRYIALNPVHGALCGDPLEWKWSAHGALAGRGPGPPFLAVTEARGWFASRSDPVGSASYREFVAAGDCTDRDDFGVAVGDEQFLRDVLPARNPGSEYRKRDWGPGRPPLPELVGDGSGAAIAVAYRQYGYTLSSIAGELGCHVATVSRRLRAHELAMLDCKI